MVGVESQVMGAGAGAGVVESLGVGDVLGAFDEAPGFGEGAAGDVVGALSLLGQRHGLLEEGEEAGFDGERGEVGGGVQEADFGVGAVDGHLGFEGLDEIQGAVGEVDGAGSDGAQADLEVGAHGGAAGAEEVGGLGGSFGLGAAPKAEEVAAVDAGAFRGHAGAREMAWRLDRDC